MIRETRLDSVRSMRGACPWEAMLGGDVVRLVACGCRDCNCCNCNCNCSCNCKGSVHLAFGCRLLSPCDPIPPPAHPSKSTPTHPSQPLASTSVDPAPVVHTSLLLTFCQLFQSCDDCFTICFASTTTTTTSTDSSDPELLRTSPTQSITRLDSWHLLPHPELLLRLQDPLPRATRAITPAFVIWNQQTTTSLPLPTCAIYSFVPRPQCHLARPSRLRAARNGRCSSQ